MVIDGKNVVGGPVRLRMNKKLGRFPGREYNGQYWYDAEPRDVLSGSVSCRTYFFEATVGGETFRLPEEGYYGTYGSTACTVNYFTKDKAKPESTPVEPPTPSPFAARAYQWTEETGAGEGPWSAVSVSSNGATSVAAQRPESNNKASKVPEFCKGGVVKPGSPITDDQLKPGTGYCKSISGFMAQLPTSYLKGSDLILCYYFLHAFRGRDRYVR